MNWILDNPVASMTGPYFLLHYFVFFLFLLAASLWLRTKIDESSKLPSVPVPSNPQPYQMAYLRGGKNEVLRLATVDLYERGILTESNATRKTHGKLVLAEATSLSDLSPLLQTVAAFYSKPRTSIEIFKSEISPRLQPNYEEWDRWIDKEQLKFSQTEKERAFVIALGASGLFLLFGLYKLLTALIKQHHNIEFLIFGAIAGAIVLLFVLRLPRFTSRGRRFIDDLQTAYASLKRPNWKAAEAAPALSTNGDSFALPIMAMGMFGIGALHDSPYSKFQTRYAASSGTGSSCGSSCGTGDSTAGSSCGGGGGGGCGGGGCGGCGG